MEYLTSCRVTKEQLEFKEKCGMKWRYLIQKGIEHITVCVPKQESISDAYRRAQATGINAKIVHNLRERYPKMHDQLLSEIMSGGV